MMKMTNASNYFVQEFVVGFGFLSGLWIHVGVDPEAEIIKAMATMIQTISPNPTYSLLFWIIPIAATIVSIIGSYAMGGWIGIFAVLFAFFGGVFISSTFGVVFLIIGVLLGFAAPHS